MFNEISSNVLKNKEPNAIKSKLARLIKTYSKVKSIMKNLVRQEKIGCGMIKWMLYLVCAKI